MNEVRLIQKVGQVPFNQLVENAARLGFALSGSPTLVSNVPVQLMVKTDVEALEPEYLLVEKTGQDKLSVQVEKLLDEGWEIYGSLVTGHVPMQAMIRGDISIHKMANIGGGEGEGKDWSQAIANSKKDAVKEANEHTDENLGLLATRVDEVNTAQNKETESLWIHVDQQRQEIDSTIRGNAMGAEQYTDEKHEEGKEFTRNAVGLVNEKFDEFVKMQQKKNVHIDMAIEANEKSISQVQVGVDQSMSSFAENFNAEIHFLKDSNESLQAEIDMLRAEHQQDIARLESMITGRTIEPAAVKMAAPAVEYPPIVPPDSVWK